MAQQPSLLTSLKTLLPETSWPWAIPALRHDPLIWDALSDPQFFDQAAAQFSEPVDWSPRNLALLTLECPEFKSIDKKIYKEAKSTLELSLHIESIPASERMSLKTASLIALGLYERYAEDDWHEIEETIVATSLSTPITILFGFVPDQTQFIISFIRRNYQTSFLPIVIQAILSQPTPLEDTQAQLQEVLAELSLQEITSFLGSLNRLRPELTMQLAIDWLENNPVNPTEGEKIDIGGLITNITDNLLIAEICSLAGRMDKAGSLKSQSLQHLKEIQIAITNQLVGETLHTNNLEQSLSLWTRLSTPSKLTPPASLVIELLQSGRVDDSLTLLPDTDENTQIPLRWLNNLYQALEKEDIAQARIFAHQALNSFKELFETDSNSLDRVFGSQRDALLYLLELIQQLTNLALYKEAFTAAQIASSIQPDNPEVLMVLTKTSRSAGEYEISIQAADLAVVNNPNDPNSRRQLAQSLEIAGQWTTSLQERQTILEHRFAQPSDPIWPTAEDLLALANCSIHADQSERALDACQKVIDLDHGNGQAHAILGEALSSLGEFEQAMEHFSLATQLTPHKASPWLSLANAYRRAAQLEKSIETLRTASHAVPDDPSIFYALGMAHLEENTPSQAQSTLARAYQLVSQPNILFVQSKSKGGNRRKTELITRNREQLCEIAMAYGDVLEQLGHPEQAKQVYENAYHAHPSFPGLAYTYAKSLMKTGDDNAALAPLAIAVAAEPSDPQPYIEYAKTLLLAGEHPQEAVQSLERALELIDSLQTESEVDLSTSRELAVALLAQAQEACGELQAALLSYSQALETNLGKTANWKTSLAIGMGRVALKLHQPEIAIAALQDIDREEILDTEIAQILCEAYTAIGLKQEALFAARTAVHLAPDDVATLAWFAERAVELGVIAEAVPAYTSAVQLDPKRTDLIIRLGQILTRMGKNKPAKEAFLSVLSSPYSQSEDLYQAAEGLSDIGEIESAAECLERALELQHQPPLSLILDLSFAYSSAGKAELAIKTLDKGIDQNPENALLHIYKADLLGKLGRRQAAQACLEHALILEPENPHVHLRIAYVLREQGELIDAFNHANLALDRLNSGTYALAARGLAAELARSTLQEEFVHQVLEIASPQEEDVGSPEQALLGEPSLFDYHCIRAEIALEREEQIAAATALNEAYLIYSEHPRVFALQARMALRQGDRDSALASITDAINLIQDSDQGELSVHLSSNSLLGIACAATELYKWDLAIETLDKAISISQNDSYLHLQKGRFYVLRAEFQRVCQAVDIINHAPGAVAVSPRTCRIFEESLQKSIQTLSEDLQAELPTLLRRWKSRGDIAFQTNDEEINVIEDLLSEPSDQAAMLLAFAQRGDSTGTAKLYHSIRSNADSETLHHSIYAAYALALNIAGQDQVAWEQALEAIQSAIEQNQTEAVYYVIQARAAESLGNCMASLNAMQTALSLWSDEPRWQAYLARLAMLNDDFPTAITHFEYAIEMEPDYLQHYLDLSQAHLKYGQAEQAIEVLKRSLRIAPEQVEAYLTLANAQYEYRDYGQAMKNAKLAANLAPDQINPLLLSAKIALKMDDPGTAKAHAEAALRIKPDDPEALHLQAQALFQSGEAERALSIVEKAIPLSANPLHLLLQRANLLSRFEGPEAKLAELQSISAEYPDEPLVLAPLAETLAETGHNSEAIQAAQQALRRSCGQLPLDEQAKLYNLLGILLRQSGQLDQSIHQLSEAIRIAPNNLDTYLELGLTQEERRQHGQALETYQKAIRAHPYDPRPYYQAGLLLKASRDYPAAESMLRRAAEKAPDDVAIHRQLAALVALNLVHSRQPVSSGG
jgi:tetratricopeptide (TPR) repeat protein